MVFLIGDMLYIILLNMDGHNTVKVRNCWGNTEISTCESKCFFQLSLPLRASEVAFDSEVHSVSEVSPFGEVANLTSLRPQGATSLCGA